MSIFNKLTNRQLAPDGQWPTDDAAITQIAKATANLSSSSWTALHIDYFNQMFGLPTTATLEVQSPMLIRLYQQIKHSYLIGVRQKPTPDGAIDDTYPIAIIRCLAQRRGYHANYQAGKLDALRRETSGNTEVIFHDQHPELYVLNHLHDYKHSRTEFITPQSSWPLDVPSAETFKQADITTKLDYQVKTMSQLSVALNFANLLKLRTTKTWYGSQLTPLFTTKNETLRNINLLDPLLTDIAQGFKDHKKSEPEFVPIQLQTCNPELFKQLDAVFTPLTTSTQKGDDPYAKN